MSTDTGASAQLTVVVPTCNRPELILETLRSLSRQASGLLEAVVVDDASDRPPQLTRLQDAAGHVPVRLLRHDSRRGGPAAKNTGATAARTELITFVDDDDMFADGFAERALQVFSAYPRIDLLFFGVTPFGDSAEAHDASYQAAMSNLLSLAPGAQPEPGVRIFDRTVARPLLSGVPMAFQQVVARRTFFQRLGGYRDVRTQWDAEIAIRAALHGVTALLEDRLYLWRVSGQSYYTDRDTLLSVCEADVAIKDRLRAEFASTVVPVQPDAVAKWLASASADAHLELARAQLLAGSTRSAARAWIRSLRIDPSLRRAKFAARILLDGVWTTR